VSRTAQAPPRFAAPKAARRDFVEAMNARDLPAALACFARDGCLITPDATAIHGREAIAAVLAQLIERHTEIEVVLSDALEAGEVVLAAERWRIRSSGAGAEAFVQESRATLVSCRIEGSWRLSILAPWGWGPPTAAPVPAQLPEPKPRRKR
jgi:uncharacterized protein (TIGR02246 family)